MAMNRHQRAPRHDEPTIRRARVGRDGALDLSYLTHVDWAHLHPERGRHGLDGGELAGSRGQRGIAKHPHSLDAGCDLFEQFQPFRAQAVFERGNPVALPPGRARLSTNPAPTGSGTITNTIGMVRVACSNGAAPALPVTRMTSGASATNSAA